MDKYAIVASLVEVGGDHLEGSIIWAGIILLAAVRGGRRRSPADCGTTAALASRTFPRRGQCGLNGAFAMTGCGGV